MSARSQALVPLSAEQQAAWRAVAETENAATRWKHAGGISVCGGVFPLSERKPQDIAV